MTPPPGSAPDPSTDPARAWVAHLRAGGTTPWLTFLDPPNREKFGAEPGEAQGRAAGKSGLSTAAPRPAGVLPGAAQLELVRRLAQRYDVRSGPAGREAFAELADRALDRAGPGRGRPDLPLLRPGVAPSGVGAPPTDPSKLPADELIRPGIGLLADLLLGEPVPDDPQRERVRRRPWSRQFHLAGAPVTSAAVRASLAAAGHLEGGRRPEVVILAEPLDVHLAQVWSTRVQHGAPVRWRTFAARWAHRNQLPPSAELTRIAAHWAERVGTDRVHVVVGGTGPQARRTTADVLRLGAGERPTGDPADLPPEAVDLLRRLNSLLTVRTGAADADRLRRRMVRLLDDLTCTDRAGISLPPRHRDWLDARAEALAADLRRGGYAVHGDLDRIAPRHRGRPHPSRPDVLELVLDSCLALTGLDSRQSGAGVTDDGS